MKRAESLMIDAETRRILEERREARKQKLAMRICKSSGSTASVASIEAITGTLRSKKPLTATAPPVATAARPVKLPTVAKKEIVPTTKPEANKQQQKKIFGFRQTATSMKRAEMAQAGVKSKVPVTKPTVVANVETKKPSVAHVRAVGLLKKKLTVPHSPNFSVRRQTIAQKPIPNPSIAASTTTVIDGSPSRRSSITWNVPFTPEARQQGNSPLRTPKVKIFTRKSFSETKSPARKVPAVPVQMIRSSSSASLARLSRPSVAFASSISTSRFSRSFFDLPKELSEKEKLQQWLEKKGRSGCRHLGCLGPQQRKEYEALSNTANNSARKSIKVTKPLNANHHHHHHEESANVASPQLKRKSTASVLNTTFEHEHDDEEQSEAAAVQSLSNDNNDVMNESIGTACAVNEVEEEEDKFQTPGPSSSPDDVALDINALNEGRVDELLETILALVQAPVYEESKIEHWINKSADTFPAVKTHALYWEIKARIEERRGNTMEALDIYSAAVSSKVEPIDTMQKLFDDFLLRVGTDMPVGEGTPLLRSLGVGTPMIRNQRKRQQRRPLIDAHQAFKSTTVKYELKLQAAFNETTTKMNKKENMTPLKLAAGPNRLSVVGQGADSTYKLVATPVRRSMRPKSPRLVFGKLPTQHEGHTFVVDNLDDLSPQMKAKVDLRQNAALGNLE